MKTLSNNDWIILNVNNNPVRFSDGDIVIYGSEREAKDDSIEGETVVNGLDIDEKLKEELTLQINYP